MALFVVLEVGPATQSGVLFVTAESFPASL